MCIFAYQEAWDMMYSEREQYMGGDCGQCSGDGTITVNVCYEDKKIKCPRCKGSGKAQSFVFIRH